MRFVDNLKKEFEEEKRIIRVRGEISGSNWAEISIISLNQQPISLGTPNEEAKIRFQTLVSGATCFSSGNYRIDNHTNKSLHEHFLGSENPLDIHTLSGALIKILGSEFEVFKK